VSPRGFEGEQRRRQRGEPKRRAAARAHREQQRGREQQPLEHLLHDVQVGQPACVVLTPVPDRERRAPIELEADRPVVEDAERV